MKPIRNTSVSCGAWELVVFMFVFVAAVGFGAVVDDVAFGLVFAFPPVLVFAVAVAVAVVVVFVIVFVSSSSNRSSCFVTHFHSSWARSPDSPSLSLSRRRPST